MPNVTPPNEKLIAGLRKALAGPIAPTGAKGMFAGAGAAALAQQARDDGYVEDTPPAAGSRAKTVPVRLTEKGRQALADTENPKAVLEQFLPTLKAIESAVADISRQLNAVLPLVEAALGRLQPSSPKAARSLREVLQASYDELTLFTDFRTGFVPLPRMYQSAKRAMPELTLAKFHHEVESLRDAREIELHVLNEVHRAENPELAIRREGRLYYYLFWKQR